MSIFGDVENIVNDDTVIIEQFLKDNYIIIGSYTIKDGVVDVDSGVTVKNIDIESLTNGLFRFGTVQGGFWCNNCKKLTSLKGAPKYVGGDFWCNECPNLKSLKGAPKKVGGDFWCDDCKNLMITDQDREKYKIIDQPHKRLKQINNVSK